MQINWFTFAAQIVNFLVLVWILKRLLYQPVVRAMQQREQTIAARLQSAHDEHTRAMDLQADYAARLHQLMKDREAAMAAATAEVQAWKQSQVHLARHEVDVIRGNWFRLLEREKNSIISEMQHNAAEHVLQISRVVLAQLAGRELEQSMVDAFLSQWSALDAEHLQSIRSALTDHDRTIVVQSGFPLQPGQQQQIAESVHAVLNEHDASLSTEFVVNPDLICGIELLAGSHKVAWSARESLEVLNERFTRVLDAAMSTAAQASGPTAAAVTAVRTNADEVNPSEHRDAPCSDTLQPGSQRETTVSDSAEGACSE